MLRQKGKEKTEAVNTHTFIWVVGNRCVKKTKQVQQINGNKLNEVKNKHKAQEPTEGSSSNMFLKRALK